MIRVHILPAPRAVLLALVLAGCAAGQSTPTPPATTQAATRAGPSSTLAATATTASCTAPATATISETEGPYFKAGSPERSLLADAGSGTPLAFTGQVVDTSCRPIANAVVDIWQADSTGAYDNAGYVLRGHVSTDASGLFTFQTIIPGQYPGRTEHIHVKVTPPGGSTLTTQVYFPGVTANDGDGIYDPSLLLALTPLGTGFTGTFTFVLATA